MKQNKILIIALALMMTFAYALTVMAGQGRMHHKGSGMGHKFAGGEFAGAGFIKSLNLSEEQKKQAAAIIKSHKDAIKSNMESMMNLRQAMSETMHADVFDEQALRSACQDLSRQKEEMIVLRAKIINELRPILTSDQISQLKARKSRKSGKMKLHFEKKWSRFESWLDELER